MVDNQALSHRSIGKMVALTIVTLGFYQLYWTYKTRQELVGEGLSVPRFILLLIPYIVTGIGLFVTLYAFFQNGSSEGTQSNEGTALFIIGIAIICIAAIVHLGIVIYWYYKYSQAVEVVTNKDITFTVSYALFLIFMVIGVGFIWPFIIQDAFNKVVDSRTQLTR